MIGYPYALADILADVSADDRAKKRKKPWTEKAKEASGRVAQSGKGTFPPLWSEVKSVFVARQHGKCAYCERMLGEHVLAAVESDVEHFRPKSAVKAWPTPEAVRSLGLPRDFPRSAGSGRGSRRLAYHVMNYAVACKTCNSALKANYFPVEGKHQFAGTDPAKLNQTERPYLVYPLGDCDVDPEKVIGFHGFVAVPRGKGHGRNRARVTIAFFRLNAERDDLLLLRAKQLDSVRGKLELLQNSKSAKRKRELAGEVQALASSRNDHAGCVRALLRLYGDPLAKTRPRTRAKAEEYLRLASEYVRSKLGG